MLTYAQAMAVLTDDLFGDVYAAELLSHARWSERGPYVLDRADIGRIAITYRASSDRYAIKRSRARASRTR
jgi:hypothetical protein